MERYTSPQPPEKTSDEIVAVLRDYGITSLEAADLEALPRDSWQRIVVWHVKEVEPQFEAIGRACFGDEWQEDTWI
jgi:hypothetical protein